MIEVMSLIKQRKTVEINSPRIHQKVLKSIHQISSDEIARASKTLNLITDHIKAKKQEKQALDIVPVYLVF